MYQTHDRFNQRVYIGKTNGLWKRKVVLPGNCGRKYPVRVLLQRGFQLPCICSIDILAREEATSGTKHFWSWKQVSGLTVLLKKVGTERGRYCIFVKRR